MAKPNPVVHFEMGYEDRERMKKFYADTFGWGMQQMGKEMGEYVVVHTSETDEKGMIKEPGRINGGFYAKTASPDSHAPSVVIAVDDIHQAMKDVVAGGGKIKGSKNKPGEPDEIPGIGLWISIEDTEGNRVSLLQPAPRS